MMRVSLQVFSLPVKLYYSNYFLKRLLSLILFYLVFMLKE